MVIFALLIVIPVALSAVSYLLGNRRGDWQTADRSSAGLLPSASEHPAAVIRVYAARTVRWRGIFAVHSWIVVKERGARRYTRYDYTAWGEPIRVDGFAPDGRWFGAVPETVVRVDGEQAERLIPRIRTVVETYGFRADGDYSPWPGPNSNTFVQAALDAVPELKAVLPPTAIGKDFPYHGGWVGLTPSGTRRVRVARRLSRPDHRLGRRDRAEFPRRGARARPAPAGAEVSRDRAGGRAGGAVTARFT